MASDYQEWIVRDVKREAPRELTQKEKRANWWHYHWLHVVLAAARSCYPACISEEPCVTTGPRRRLPPTPESGKPSRKAPNNPKPP